MSNLKRRLIIYKIDKLQKEKRDNHTFITLFKQDNISIIKRINDLRKQL